MPPRSRSKAFRNAVLWTWWLPLLTAAAVAGWWYHYDKMLQDEFIAVGKIVVVLPGGEVPDEATMQAHIALLESSTIAEQAAVRTKRAHPELTQPDNAIRALDGMGGLINVVVTGHEERDTQAYLNEGMRAYIDTVEYIRNHGLPAGEKLNRRAVPMIYELAGPAVKKRREQVLPAGLSTLAGGAAGLVLMLLASGVWALCRPASTQPSMEEIVKAAEGLDAVSQAVLVKWLKGQVGVDVSRDPAA